MRLSNKRRRLREVRHRPGDGGWMTGKPEVTVRPSDYVREDHSSKSVEPKAARCTGTAIPNQASEERGRRRDWMASIPFRGMKVQSDSQRKLSQIA
jgi:hypothetical protein